MTTVMDTGMAMDMVDMGMRIDMLTSAPRGGLGEPL